MDRCSDTADYEIMSFVLIFGFYFSGKVHAIGRGEYGRLGLGKECKEQKEPKHIGTMNGTKVVSIASGSCCSFAVSADGTCYIVNDF